MWFKRKIRATDTETNIKVSITEHGVETSFDGEICFIPVNKIAGIVQRKNCTEVHSVNNSMSLFISGSGYGKYYEKIKERIIIDNS